MVVGQSEGYAEAVRRSEAQDQIARLALRGAPGAELVNAARGTARALRIQRSL